MISAYPPDENAIAEVCAWAMQTCMFAINLSHQGKPEPPDPATYYEAMKAEADSVSRRLFEDTKAECPNIQPGETMLDFIGKVFSWCAERRYDLGRMPSMKPTNEDLAHALVIIGAEAFDIPTIDDATINRLRELGLICWNNGLHELTPAGAKLLPVVLDGGSVELV